MRVFTSDRGNDLDLQGVTVSELEALRDLVAGALAAGPGARLEIMREVEDPDGCRTQLWLRVLVVTTRKDAP